MMTMGNQSGGFIASPGCPPSGLAPHPKCGRSRNTAGGNAPRSQRPSRGGVKGVGMIPIRKREPVSIVRSGGLAWFLEPALSTRILGLFYKAVSREVFVFSVVNRLLVRRLLRPALIAEQFCHVHLPSNLSEQADHFLRSQLPPSYPHVCSNVLRQRPILGRDFVREIVP